MSTKYHCTSCDYSTDRKSNWNRHLSSKLHNHGFKSYKCEKCDITFSQKCHYDKHILSNKHNNYDPPIDRRKLNQTLAYAKRYKNSMSTKKKQLRKQPHRVDEILEEIDLKAHHYEVAKERYAKQVKKQLNKIINCYFDARWMVVASWYHNAQSLTI